MMGKLLVLVDNARAWDTDSLLDSLGVAHEHRAKNIFDATHVCVVHYCFESKAAYVRLEVLARIARWIGKEVTYIEDMDEA